MYLQKPQKTQGSLTDIRKNQSPSAFPLLKRSGCINKIDWFGEGFTILSSLTDNGIYPKPFSHFWEFQPGERPLLFCLLLSLCFRVCFFFFHSTWQVCIFIIDRWYIPYILYSHKYFNWLWNKYLKERDLELL